MTKLSEMLGMLDAIGEDSSGILIPETAYLLADGHTLLGSQGVHGVELRTQEARDAIIADVIVSRAVRAPSPVHLCFGMLARSGTQNVKLRVTLEEGASATFLAHCLFAKAEFARHTMQATFEIGEGAEMRLVEGHYHGPFGGIEVLAETMVKLGSHARFFSDFSLIRGRVGKLDIDYAIEVGEHALTELTSRVFGHVTDEVKIREEVILSGKGSRSLVKTRVALEDEASAEVIGITEGKAEGARGHMDCMEIVKDHARAQSVPIVKVSHPLAKITHEAAIGTVDKKQMETLMAHGLTPEEAVDIIVSGMLR
jgi:Fe-S cluster assembly scaffold protein SufB